MRRTVRLFCWVSAAALAVAIALASDASAQVPPSPPVPLASPDMPPASPAPAPAAGIVPASLSLDVTGLPYADPVFLDAQMRAALDRAIRPTLRPGASVHYGPIVPWPLFALGSGQRATANVTVTLSGDAGSSPVSAVTTVTFNSVMVPAAEPATLYLSDDPEYVQSEGVIFRGDVTAERPARLYYYHSDIGMPRDLDVLLTASAPARVHLIASAAGPELDVMDVGHTVSRDYLRFAQNGEGIVADLVPGKPFVVRHALMLQGEVVAGTVDVRVLGGGPVTASVIGSPAGVRAETYLGGPRVPFDGHRRHGTFDLTAYGALSGSYTVGGSGTPVQYGARVPTPHNVDPRDDGHDYGDYGVVHRITFTFANTTDDPHVVYLYEKPLGGPVRSSFVIDGAFKELGCVRLPQPYLVTSYQLAPHSSGASTTLTMTDGGSFYPIEYGATEAPPQFTTPPVGSADGCSPNSPAFPDPGTRGAGAGAH